MKTSTLVFFQTPQKFNFVFQQFKTTNMSSWDITSDQRGQTYQ